MSGKVKSRNLRGFTLTTETYTRVDMDIGAWKGYDWFGIICVTTAFASFLNMVNIALALGFVIAAGAWVLVEIPKQEVVTQTWVKRRE